MAALMKKSIVIEKAESRVTCASCRTCQPSSLTSTLRVNRTTEAIVVPTIPAIRSRGLPVSGMLGANPAAISLKSGSTVPAVKKKAKPITPTREPSTFREERVPANPVQGKQQQREADRRAQRIDRDSQGACAPLPEHIHHDCHHTDNRRELRRRQRHDNQERDRGPEVPPEEMQQGLARDDRQAADANDHQVREQ